MVNINKPVSDINEFFIDLSRGNNSYMDDGEYEWHYVRVVGVIPLDEYISHYPHGEYDEEYPEGTTHLAFVGEEFLTNDNDDRPIYGDIYALLVEDGVATLLEDPDEVTGRGPDYNFANSVEEIVDWIHGYYQDAEITVYEELPLESIQWK
jgi:hypothetical protein